MLVVLVGGFGGLLVSLVMVLNVSAGTARFRQLSEAMRNTHVRREHWPGASLGVTHRRIFLPFRNDDDALKIAYIFV